MIASKQEEVFWIPKGGKGGSYDQKMSSYHEITKYKLLLDLVGQKETYGFQGLSSSIHVVSKK